MKTRITTFLIAAALCAPAHAYDAEPRAGLVVEGVQFEASSPVGDTRLELLNAALLRYRVVIKAYVAGLYVQPGIAPDEVLGDVPKRIEIEYFWAIKGDDFRKVTHQGIERNVTPETYAELLPKIEQLNAFYRDVQPGDRYAITYVPGRGTELSLNGEPLGSVEGAELAEALFGIWLGENPLDRKLKRRLLSPAG